jgi:hypothetical protein
VSLLEDVRVYTRYVRGLRPFLRFPLSGADGAALIERQRALREERFLQVLDRAVYAQPESPYRRLLEHYSIEYGDIAALVTDNGVESALSQLHDAGVYLKLEEVKGKRPLTRPGLEVAISERDLDNPLLLKHFEGRSGGSRSAGRRTVIDLAHLEFEASQSALFIAAFDFGPIAAWYPAPPSAAGLMTVLAATRADWVVERWFAQTEVGGRADTRRDELLTATTRLAFRLWAPRKMPRPEYAPLDRADAVVHWLAEKSASGTPGRLVTFPSAAVRACAHAIERGIDIEGSVFILGGEPYTEQKAAVVERAGARGVSWYGLTEAGSVGMPCADAELPDDVHVLTHKVALVTRKISVSEAIVNGLFITTLMPSAPKLLLNVEAGDYAVLEERECGCAIGAAGLTSHLHTIRSHEKLTTHGQTFLGEELLVLLHRFLPKRFGGTPEDYQLVEEEDSEGVPYVTLSLSPRLGEVPEREVVAFVLERLSAGGRPQRLMAEAWRSAGALRVMRRDPHLTAGGKVLPLHLPAHDHDRSAS